MSVTAERNWFIISFPVCFTVNKFWFNSVSAIVLIFVSVSKKPTLCQSISFNLYCTDSSKGLNWHSSKAYKNFTGVPASCCAFKYADNVSMVDIFLTFIVRIYIFSLFSLKEIPSYIFFNCDSSKCTSKWVQRPFLANTFSGAVHSNIVVFLL